MTGNTMWFYVLLCLVSGVFLYPGYQHELQRWNDHLGECTARYEENIRILQQSTCSDLFQLDSLGPKMRDLCLRARKENELTPTKCAWRAFWLQGEVYQLYTRVAHNQWILTAVVVPAVLLVIYMYMQARAEKQRLDMVAKDRHAMMEGFKSIASMTREPQYAYDDHDGYLCNSSDEYVQLALPAPRKKRRGRRRW